ncbi:MAG: GAF domain-containing protein [Chloroflexi bacterium]|nr:GAF domain-containing protein [Chloroflexota bacterium]
MKDRFPPERLSLWKQLLEISSRLIGLPSTAAQRDFIVRELSALFGCQVMLCFADTAFILPGVEKIDRVSGDTASILMKQAYETRQIQLSWMKTGQEDLDSKQRVVTMAIPLLAQDTPIGALEVTRSGGPVFSQEEIGFISEAIKYISEVLSVTHQVAIKNWRLEQLSLVRSVSAHIANILDLSELSRQVTTLIQDTFKFYYVGIFTLEIKQGCLRFRASAGSNAENHQHSDVPEFTICLGEGIVGQVAATGEEILAADVRLEPRYHYVDSLPETQSEYALPLKIENRVLGVLDIQNNRLNAFHEIDRMVLQVLADNIAVAVEGARLYDNLKRRTDQIAAVSEVSRAITSILDLDQLLDEIVTLLHKRFGYPFVHIFTVHPGRRKVIYQAGSGKRSQAFREQGLTYDLDAPQGVIPWVARTGKTVVANDIEKEPLYLPSPLLPLETRSELAVPLLFGDDVLGVMDVQSDQYNAFDDDARSLFEALADTIAVAVRNAFLYYSESWRRQVADSLRDIAGLLSSGVTLDQMLEAILTELDRNLPCDVAAIWLIDEGTSPSVSGEPSLYLAAIHGRDSQRINDIRSMIPGKDYWLSKTFYSDQPIIRPGEDQPGPLGRALSYPPAYSSIGAPLRVGDRRLGVMALAHPTSGRYGSEAQKMTAAFASYAAVAIDNAKLYDTAQDQAWVATVMLQVSEATQSLSSVNELLNTIARLTPMLVGVKGCAFFLWDPGSERYQLAAAHGIDAEYQADLRLHPIKPGEALAFDEVRFGKQPVFIQDCQQELRLAGSVSCVQDNYVFVLLPLLTHNEVLGAFLIEHLKEQPTPEGANTIVDERLAVLQGIAQQAAVGVENIHLLEAKQEEAYVTAVLLQVAQTVVSSNELEDILASILQTLPILIGIDCSVIYLWDERRQVFHLGEIYPGTWEIDALFSSRAYSTGEYPLLDGVKDSDDLVVCQTEEALSPDRWLSLIPQASSQSDTNPLLEKSGSLVMGFPLSVKGDVYGVLLTQESGVAPAFRERRVEIIHGVTQQISLAIQNDRFNKEVVEHERLEREFQLAREIQQAFLPGKLPSIGGWEMDVRWRPARQVGGDFYDVFHLPGRKLGLVIADVSDKGMPAALYMTVTRTLIRAAAQEISSPAKVLKRVNDLLLMDSQYAMFVTAIYAIVSLKDGSVLYANAGHNIPLLVKSGTNQSEHLAKGGTALAVFKEINLEDHRVVLSPGDSLVLYTDGITEAFSPEGEIFGEERLLEAIQSRPAQTAQELAGILDRSNTEFSGDAPPSDDITLLVLHRSQIHPH